MDCFFCCCCCCFSFFSNLEKYDFGFKNPDLDFIEKNTASVLVKFSCDKLLGDVMLILRLNGFTYLFCSLNVGKYPAVYCIS